MKNILVTLIISLFGFAALAQDASVVSSDYVVEVQLSEADKADNLNLRYGKVVSVNDNVLVVKTSEDKSTFAEKELKKLYPSASVSLMSGDAYLNRTKSSNK
jgi:hypothetical protein